MQHVNKKLYQSVVPIKKDNAKVVVKDKVKAVDRTFNAGQLPEISINAKKQYKHKGCVAGLSGDLCRSLNISSDDFRKSNNFYGNAWDILDNAYGKDIVNPKDYRVNDIVSLTRDRFDSDKENNIPDKNQHIGRISKIVNGIPYVKHYISKVGTNSKGEPYGDYFEEPINDISKFTKYTPTRVKRLDQFKDINIAKEDFKFDDNYKANYIEKSVLKTNQNKEKIQNTLKLDSAEYKNLSKLAYGIMGAESNYGRSKRTLYRMATPDVIQKGVKIADDFLKDKNVYDENINNLSSGYSSTKESSLHGISDNTGKLSSIEIRNKVKSGDYTDLEKTNNYLENRFNKFGINTKNLDDGYNSYLATLSNLAWHKKRNPNLTDEELLKKYTGKKNITAYKAVVEGYKKNIDGNPENNKKYTVAQNILGASSSFANQISHLKNKSISYNNSFIRDILPLPVNVKGLIGDVTGAMEPITEKTLSASENKALQNIVRNNILSGRNTIEYDDYKTSANKNDDVGVEKISAKKALFDDNYKLKTLLGQANIRKISDNEYEVTDTYDFNDKGKSFGILDDIKKRGGGLYNITRSIGRNYGSSNGQGAKVKIKINL